MERLHMWRFAQYFGMFGEGESWIEYVDHKIVLTSVLPNWKVVHYYITENM